jgi:hypothetical protein
MAGYLTGVMLAIAYDALQRRVPSYRLELDIVGITYIHQSTALSVLL